jgi:hypothetical protein
VNPSPPPEKSLSATWITRVRVAQEAQVGGYIDLRALGKRADPAVQKRTRGLGDQEDEQRVSGDHVLEVQLVGVEQHRQRGQRRAPPGQPAMAQQGVDGHADDDPHRRLEQPDRVVAVQREQDVEEERVAVRPDVVRDVRHRVVQVVAGVAEPQDGRIAEDHHDAHRGGGQHNQAELPVRDGQADQPRPQRVPLSRGRLLTGYDPLATGGRVRQRPPPDS